MKQKLLHIIICLICALAWSGEVWGQTTSYVLQKADEKSLFQGAEGETLTLSGPGATISFEGCRDATSANYFYLETSSDGISWNEKEKEIDLKVNGVFSGKKWTKYTYNITNINVRYIRFKRYFGATLNAYYRDVKVTRATLLENFPYTTSVAFDMGSLRYGKSTTISINNITYHNTTYPQNLTGTCSMASGTEAGTFSVGTVAASAATGTINIPITFSPKSPGAKSATVTLKLGSTTVATFKVTGTGADKGTPAFTWNVTNAFKNHSYSDFFTSTNTDTDYTINSNEPSLGKVVNGKLVFYDGVGTVRFTVTQAGNDDWNAHEEYFDVTVTETQNHLPITINSSNYGTLVRKVTKGTCEWSNNGLTLKDNGFDDKIGEIVFEGIPDKLTFTYTRNNGTAVGMDWRVLVSPDGNNWTKVWSEDNNSGSCDFTFGDTYVNCRYVRLLYSGDYGGTFRDVTITERKYLTADKTSLAFGTNTKGSSVAGQTFTLSHCNAGFGVTATSNNANFTVSPTSLTTTGGDAMGTQLITVNYLNNVVGVHSGKIIIHDPSRNNEDVTINVSGTTQTKYYTRAEASASTGGTAFVSFASFANATSSSAETNSGLTTEASANATAYYKAAAEGYVFLGWTLANKEYSEMNVVSHDAEFKHDYTYDSESSGNGATLDAYKAWFAPVFGFAATVNKNRDGGDVTASVAENSITGAIGAASASTSATFTVTSTKSGYVFKGWKENLTDAEYKSTSTTYTTSDNDDVLNNEPGTTVTKTMVAIFAPIYKFAAESHVGNVAGGTVEVATVANETVEADPSASSASTEASFRATASEDYTFMGWSETSDGNVISGSNVSNYTPTIINNGEPGSEVKLVLYAIFKLKRINLYPNSKPSYTAGDYEEVKLHNTLKSGYSTIALPFNTTVETLTGREANPNDWVAQLSVVTYNAKDGYSLYFEKKNAIEANQPYILHLGTAVDSPVFTNVSVVAAATATQNTSNGVGYNDWTMHSNYSPNFDMEGKYGVVNGEGVLKKGAANSTLKAFHAYITGPAAAGVKAAYLDEDEADGILELLNAEAPEPENIYDLQGRQLPRAGKGINIIRNADGTVRKVMLK